MNMLIHQLIGGPSDFGVGWIIILLSAIITIVVSLVSFTKWLVKKMQGVSRALELVSLLDTGAHISHYMTLLGNPVYIGRNGHFQEHIFVNYYFYVQTLADPNGQVALFSVTTRRKSFHPVLKTQFDSPLVKLGQTNFLRLGTPKKVFTSGDHGAITTYAESYYFGFDGDYRTYAFSFNPNGYGKLAPVPSSFGLSNALENPEEVKIFRENTIVNTYTISSLGDVNHNFQELGSNVTFGPKHYQIRVFAKK